MYQIHFLENALEDLKEIVSYIAHTLRNPLTAEKLSKEILSQIKNLATFPYQCPAYQTLYPLSHEFRRLRVKNYFIFYWIEEDKHEVIIARVIYARRNIQNLLN